MSSVPPNDPRYPPGTPISQPLASGQPVVVAPAATPPQQVIVQQAPRETAAEARAEARAEAELERQHEVVVIYSHSNFFYWWPVWVAAYVMAVLSRFPAAGAQQIDIGGHLEWFNPSKNLGVIFTLTFFLVILITNVTVRGLSSLVVILVAVLGVVLVLYFGWWDQLTDAFNTVSIHMNMGFYVCFGTLIFLVWAVSTFVYDRLSYWRVTPGQITHEFLIGGAAKSYDTRGMVFEKHRNDLFRHWILGIGSGDLNISTTGAQKQNISVPNVLFVDSKVAAIQKMIAMKPDQFATPPV